jgi:hypothetical protein
MANRLKKLATAQYQPGTPYQPGVVGYCYMQEYAVPGHWVYDLAYATQAEIDAGVPPVRTIGQHWEPAGVAYREVCVPSSPAVPGTPSLVTYTAINGWNGGAVSVVALTGNGYFGFFISDVPAGVAVGLTSSDVSTLPSEASHAFYVHGTVVDIMEHGVVVATCPVAHNATKQYRIARSGNVVNYAYGGWTYTSGLASSGTRYLDASIYASGDYVDTPTLGAIASISASSSFGFVSALGLTVGGVGEVYGVRASFGFTGFVDAVPVAKQQNLRPRSTFGMTGASGFAADQELSVSASFGFNATARVAYSVTAGGPVPAGYNVASASGRLPALLGAASEGAYNYAIGVLPAIGGEAYGGYPVASLSYGYGILPQVAGFAYIPTGEVGTASGVLPALGGLASENAYAEARGVLPAFTGHADNGDVDPNTKSWGSSLIAADSYLLEVNLNAAYSDGLEIQDGMFATLTVADSVMDALMLVDGVGAQYTIAALIQSGLLLGSGSSNASAAATQYAVNVLTSALGTYEGFEFKAFAATGTAVYGLRADGVYLVRAGDDNGAPVTVTVDFGSDAFGSQHAKHVNALYFGIATDGQVFAKLTADDGVERVYRVTQRGSSARAVTSQRVTGRLWNLTLEVADATDFSLDTVELFVAASTRRWVR